MILESLNSGYSSTRRVTRTAPEIREHPEARFNTELFLTPHPERSGEGGLRTQGYFKTGGYFSRGFKDAKTRPLVTVITVVLNGALRLEESILSVLHQTYDNVEYIIIDGGSTDDTRDIIRKYEHAIDYWVSEPDLGIYDAWNKGVRLSSGEWIAFLGADDLYLEGAIQAYANAITACQDNLPEYVSSRVNLTSGSKVLRTVGQQWKWKVFRKYMNVAHPGSFHHRTLFDKHGLFDVTYKICGDYEFLLRSGAGLRAAFVDGITANMRPGGISDFNGSVFRETARAKTTTGKRGVVVSRIETIWALCKWKLRHWLWY